MIYEVLKKLSVGVAGKMAVRDWWKGSYLHVSETFVNAHLPVQRVWSY